MNIFTILIGSYFFIKGFFRFFSAFYFPENDEKVNDEVPKKLTKIEKFNYFFDKLNPIFEAISKFFMGLFLMYIGFKFITLGFKGESTAPIIKAVINVIREIANFIS